jgi:predicted nuclease of predicted toxin-antitoxin system
MRFIADESCDFKIVQALRSEGFDVFCIAESSPGVSDSSVIQFSIDENRILLTEDRDFGQWVFAHGFSTASVIFFRYPATARTMIAKDIVKFLKENKELISGCFIVIQPGRTRISRTPIE